MESAAARHEEKPPLRAVVAEEVLALMGRRRVSQKRLAEHLRMSQPSLSKRLNGYVPWTVDELESIAAYFNVPLTSLLPETHSRWSSTTGPRPVESFLGQPELPFTVDRVLVSV